MTDQFGWFLGVLVIVGNSMYRIFAVFSLVNSTTTEHFEWIFLPITRAVIQPPGCDIVKKHIIGQTCDVTIDKMTAGNAYATAILEAIVIAAFLCLLYATYKKSEKMMLPAFCLITITILYNSLMYIFISTRYGIILRPYLTIYNICVAFYNVFMWVAIYIFRQRYLGGTEDDYELSRQREEKMR